MDSKKAIEIFEDEILERFAILMEAPEVAAEINESTMRYVSQGLHGKHAYNKAVKPFKIRAAEEVLSRPDVISFMQDQ